MTGSGGTLGKYSNSTHTVHLNRRLLASDPKAARRTLWHEMMHHVHLEGPAWYKQAIADHYHARTAAEPVDTLPGYSSPVLGKRDAWYDPYAGRLYGWETDNTGVEIPTRYIELLSAPEDFALTWNHPKHQETLRVVMSILLPPPP